MLRTNLSTRPFYNERAVLLAVGAVTALVVAVTAFNLREVYSLSGRDARVMASIAKSEARGRDLRTEAARIRSSINPRELESVAAASREANDIIERRMFSWTELFNRFENTLPASVRIASVRPRVETDGSITMQLGVVARDVEGVNTFIENLEREGGFHRLLSREEFMDEDGLLKATLEGRYLPGAPPAAGTRSGTP